MGRKVPPTLSITQLNATIVIHNGASISAPEMNALRNVIRREFGGSDIGWTSVDMWRTGYIVRGRPKRTEKDAGGPVASMVFACIGRGSGRLRRPVRRKA